MRALLFAAALAAAAPASADVTIRADVSKTDVTMDEQIALSVTVSGSDSDLPEPRMPAMTGLSVYDSGRSQSLSIINGRVSSSVVHTYVVIPRAAGKAVIPPITVAHKGQAVRTEPIELNVRRSGASTGPPGPPAGRPQAPAVQGQRGRDVFVTAELDKKTAFVNEQVTLTVRFFTGVPLLQGTQYFAPGLSGFLAEDLPPERTGATTIEGRPYNFSEVKTALFPAQSGTLTIGAAVARAALPPAMNDPAGRDFFSQFFQGMQPRVVELKSDPLTLRAEPLPEEGKPQGFSGAVGVYSIGASVDRTKVKAGDAVNLTVTVSGRGNIKSVDAPKLPEIPSARVFETVSSMSVDKKGDVVSGSKSFKTVVVPRVSGPLTIPPISYSFFDPASRAYRTVETRPISLDVAPGEAGAPETPGTAATPRGVTVLSQDLRYLKTAPRRGAATAFLEAVASAGPLHAVPFAAFLASLGATFYKRRESLDPAGARSRSALKTARRKLESAASASDAAQALAGYIADKTGQTPSALTMRKAQELVLARRPQAAAAAASLKELWEELDMRRFAPSASGESPAETAARVERLLETLEKEVFA